MAKATTGSVTLDLTPREAKVLHALVGTVGCSGPYSQEISEIYDALEGAGVDSDNLTLEHDDGTFRLVGAK